MLMSCCGSSRLTMYNAMLCCYIAQGPVTRKMFPFDDVIMIWINHGVRLSLIAVICKAVNIEKHKLLKNTVNDPAWNYCPNLSLRIIDDLWPIQYKDAFLQLQRSHYKDETAVRQKEYDWQYQWHLTILRLWYGPISPIKWNENCLLWGQISCH